MFRSAFYVACWGRVGGNRLVPYFGGRSLDTDPDFAQYRHFYGAIIDVHTDRNPPKVGMQH